MEKQNSNIDISNLSYNFCDDDFIDSYLINKISDRDGWIKRNRENLIQNRDKIAKAVQDGLIANDNPETVWQFEFNRIKKGKDEIIKIKKEIEKNIEQININIAKKLSVFLPDWKCKEVSVAFTMNDKADFCVDGNKITVDLSRLLESNDFFEEVTEGITHEVFHIWMKEKNKWSDSSQDNESDESFKSQIIFKIIDEGLAVLVSEQSLKEHHEKQGREYKKYITESFNFFQEFLKQNNRVELEKVNNQAFKNMGYFYVVGNEIAKTVLQQIGIEKFKKLIQDCRLNPQKIIEEYESVCNNDFKITKNE